MRYFFYAGKMTRKLPPLNSLRALEAASRHSSFKLSARELGVTPAAVGHHVKSLEDHFGVQLFIRSPRTLRLTEAGRAVLPILSEGLDKFQEAVDHLDEYSTSGLLTISVSPGFGSMWLVPRLDRFYAKYPDIEIRLDGTDRTVDVARGEADLAIRYGPGNYPNVKEYFLFNQVNTPVCNPSLTKGPNALRTPEDLQNHTLLHVDWKGTDASWRMWLLAAGQSQINPARGPHFTQESMAVQAAIDGHGVALIGNRVIEDHLASGSLVCPFDASLRTPLNFSYYLLCSPDRLDNPKTIAFRDWILEEVSDNER